MSLQNTKYQATKNYREERSIATYLPCSYQSRKNVYIRQTVLTVQEKDTYFSDELALFGTYRGEEMKTVEIMSVTTDN